MTDLVYVYAVLVRPLPRAIHGINNRPVRWVQGNGLAAAVSDVPTDDFDEEPLNVNVRDMAWLGPRAVAHQEAISQLFEEADAVVPLSFGTVFRDDSRVQDLLHSQGETLRQRLEGLTGTAEWVVALHVLSEPDVEAVASASPAVQAARADIATSSPGRAHLLKRQLATLERDEARRVQSEAAAQVVEALHKVTRDVYQEPLPTDTVERPLLRASVLVARSDETTFLDEIDRIRQRWPEPTYRLLLTGPWPPYRFGGLPSERA